jgi:hypothetical protein
MKVDDVGIGTMGRDGGSVELEQLHVGLSVRDRMMVDRSLMAHERWLGSLRASYTPVVVSRR